MLCVNDVSLITIFGDIGQVVEPTFWDKLTLVNCNI